MAASGSQTQTELVVPDIKDKAYQQHRAQTDLREPYSFPSEVLQNTKKEGLAYDVAESPMLAFINARSGGRVGPKLLQSLYRALSNAQVYDVLVDHPDVVLKKIWDNLEALEKAKDPRAAAIKERMKVVACGGDGTVTWILKVVKDLELNPPPAVAIMPLGTGNDLSRTYKWGNTFRPRWIANSSTVYERLREVSDGAPKELDCWQIDIRAPSAEYFKEIPHVLKHSNEEKSSVSGGMWNYLSFGRDAQSAHGFHHLREKHPSWAAGRMMNQFWYSWFGLKSGWFCCCNSWNPPVSRTLNIEILTTDDQWKKLDIPDSVKAVVLVNLQSYAGGRNIWGKGKLSKKEMERGLVEPSLSDGLFEVVGFRTGWHTGFVMVGLAHCVRLGQGKGARIRAAVSDDDPAGEQDSIFMQIDGEPWKQIIPTKKEEVLSVDVLHNGRSSLLMNKTLMKEQDFKEEKPDQPGTSNLPVSDK